MKEGVGQVVVVIAVVALLAGALVWAVGSRLQSGGPPPQIADADGERPLDYCGRSVSDFYGSGQFPDPAADGRKHGEAFTMTRLWYAWFEDGKSMPLAVEARLSACNRDFGFPSPPDNVYYRFLYSEDGSSWRGFSQGTQESLAAGVYHDTVNLGLFDKDVALGAFSLQIDGFQWQPCVFDDSAVKDFGRGMEKYDVQCDKTGATEEIQDGAALRVQVLVARYNAPLGFGNYEPMLVFQDEVELRSALPEVGWRETSYEVGGVAVVEWSVPTTTYETCDSGGSCTTRAAYFLEVRDMNVNGPVRGLDRVAVGDLSPDRSGSANIRVDASFFSNDLATCQNRLRALLYSELIVVDQADVSVQQKEAALGVPAPAVTEISADKDEYSEGDLVSLSWEATGNVTRYHVVAHVGGLLLTDRDQTGRNASFVAPRTGILEVEVVAYNLCQPSDVRKEQWTVGAVFTGLCEQFPEAKDCDEPAGDLLATLRAVAAFLAALVVFALVLWALVRADLDVPAPILLLVAAGAGVATLIAFISWGWLDALMFYRRTGVGAILGLSSLRILRARRGKVRT